MRRASPARAPLPARAHPDASSGTAPIAPAIGQIGISLPRIDGTPKVRGEFAYSSDLQAPGMLYGHTVRSPHAHARILTIEIAEAVSMPGVHAVLTHTDIPGA